MFHHDGYAPSAAWTLQAVLLTSLEGVYMGRALSLHDDMLAVGADVYEDSRGIV